MNDPDVSAVDDVACDLHRGPHSVDEAHGGRHAGVCHRLAHLASLWRVECDWFLAHDDLPVGGCAGNHRGVRVVRGHDVDKIEVVGFGYFVPVVGCVGPAVVTCGFVYARPACDADQFELRDGVPVNEREDLVGG